MNNLTLDIECTISNNGNPFDTTNKLVCAGFKFLNMKAWDIYLNEIGSVKTMQDFIDQADILVGFNIKFDLHWLQKIGINFKGKRIWDCQLAEYILNYQKTPYPSLNKACDKYGLKSKLDIVKTEYWDKGINTDAIPTNILSEYLKQDLVVTEQVYLKQLAQFKQNTKLFALFKLQCWDLLTLQEMEYNGIFFNVEKAKKKADEILSELTKVYASISRWFNGAPINLNSNDHCSCLLYGGIVKVDDRIPVGVFKTGAKIGETRYKLVTREFNLPRLVEPIKGTELEKEGYWSTSDKAIRSLKPKKEVKALIKELKRYSELEKLRSTYMIGYPKLMEEMNWEPNMIHGNFNQCVAITGRLSSSKPNLQNCDPETKRFMESIYVDI